MTRYVKALALVILAGSFFFPGGTGMCGMKEGAVSLNAVGGGYFFEGNQNMDDSLMGGLGLSYALDSRWALEYFASYGHFTANYEGARCNCSEKETGLYGVATWVDVLYQFEAPGKAFPFLTAGVGGLFLEDFRAVEEKASFLVNLGGGINFEFTEKLMFRTELLYVFTTPGAHSNAMALAGFSYAIWP